ncbi:MAG: purine-nucleoside phosphorylase [Cyclobacteriaceae bacterium]|nr:purine-nucleoside phosphorylase [Cyclobacteriaceae bacterium]
MKNIREAATYIKAQLDFKPETGIILGTGLGGLAKLMDVEKEISYDDIPHFPISTVESHHGELLLGTLNGKKVVVMQGRFHYYEGYTLKQVTFPVRVMKLLGIKQLFVSNAAGGLNTGYKIADLMILNDHINLQPDNPLAGANYDELGPRFPDMSQPYSHKLIKKGIKIAAYINCDVHQGVYAVVPGPNLETPAEYRYLSIIGADAVGMSTVPEVIVARHMGIPCFAVSVITDLCYPGAIEEVKIEKILAAAAKAEPFLTELMSKMLNS